MKIALVDVDGHGFPNLALMRLAAWHRAQGDIVTAEYDTMYTKPDRIYASKIFRFSPDADFSSGDPEPIRGGTGYDATVKLPDEVEAMQPDYSIYPQYDRTVQFYSRGCIRKCPFCIVPIKEGFIRPVAPINLNPRGGRTDVLDNNFFANPEWRSAIYHLQKCDREVNFHGVDVRIITEEQCSALATLRHAENIKVAWDDPRDNIAQRLDFMAAHIPARQITCYVLIGFWSTPEEDEMRVRIIAEKGIRPFVMPYDKENLYQANFTRWCNGFVFKTCAFKDYKAR